jgi:hypothetical protein
MAVIAVEQLFLSSKVLPWPLRGKGGEQGAKVHLVFAEASLLAISSAKVHLDDGSFYGGME